MPSKQNIFIALNWWCKIAEENSMKDDSEARQVIVENPYHDARKKDKRKGKKPPKLLAIVHQSGCTGCEVCIAGCPVDSIELVSGPNPANPTFSQMVEIDLARCIGCQNCSYDCPWETITMYQHDDAFAAWSGETLKSELYITEPDLQKLDQEHGVDREAVESVESSGEKKTG